MRKLRLATRAVRQNRRKFANNCKEFLNQTYQFARKLFSPKPRGELKSTKEVERHLAEAHEDHIEKTKRKSARTP